MQQKLIELALRTQESNRKVASCIDSVQTRHESIQEHWWSKTCTWSTI